MMMGGTILGGGPEGRSQDEEHGTGDAQPHQNTSSGRKMKAHSSPRGGGGSGLAFRIARSTLSSNQGFLTAG